jgi:hypothetical protein
MATFPGLPEELMNIGAIDLTVGAHDARNAVHRLTLLVSDPRCPARIIPVTPPCSASVSIRACTLLIPNRGVPACR